MMLQNPARRSWEFEAADLERTLEIAYRRRAQPQPLEPLGGLASQGLGRELVEEPTVASGEAPELPHAVPQEHVGYGSLVRLGATQRALHLVESSKSKILRRAKPIAFAKRDTHSASAIETCSCSRSSKCALARRAISWRDTFGRPGRTASCGCGAPRIRAPSSSSAADATSAAIEDSNWG